jgi:hypothetical protein
MRQAIVIGNMPRVDFYRLSIEAFNAFTKTEVDATARTAKAAALKGQ